MIPENLRYHKEHEWVRAEGKKATIGISHFAQEALGDIVYLEIPKTGVNVQYGNEITEIESTKTTSPLYAPVGGKVVAVNEKLKEKPELINQDPYGEGWVVVIEMNDPKEVEKLMTAKEYDAFLQKEAH
ncbi:MAG: glycine cleavage system protein GcvH [Candidatus Manganitrophus sp.]|jgi:glycine cleavage system H protein|uniref:Glycine cleavage system H protein n=1 Tax=Candidatus Manganitrophus noduliformans TaxID=2606439 RepID=A0A7X6IDA7_9BACT|nr:glycine cleavage system protein GcvH [Candidatus Manganitrophus noduliformans]MDC4203337.1 glycine cleavage system protein GcvH [Candidatus Manganitrophus sp.]MDC4227137.1 glycine cleavage system protein GcvH [Candidatus Manganitrophus sp.]NKE73721.1 glycine cleavage system protein GcvH [Candidatus Manganitrophus noduliformans]WDT71727.1 MAG: glycine cleavage system protein GcvH [Candidatus Manganitrophus sp.]WDT80901.1 MAG: glycine cleavage system protein GcvH [Candidatus Manganitrophus sp